MKRWMSLCLVMLCLVLVSCRDCQCECEQTRVTESQSSLAGGEGTSQAPSGEKDKRCPGAQLKIITAEGIAEQTMDPTSAGKVTIIGFWGGGEPWDSSTLTFLSDISREYADSVRVFAIHTYIRCDTVPGYIGAYYPDSDITFLCDYCGENGDSYNVALGGGNGYPYIVVIDESGIIIYKQGNIECQEVYEAIRSALANE